MAFTFASAKDIIVGIASKTTSILVLLAIFWIVYKLFDKLDVTSVLFTFTLLILYPLSGEKLIVADEPSFTVKVLVLPLIEVPLYEAEPLPTEVISKVKLSFVVPSDIFSNLFHISFALYTSILPSGTNSVAFLYISSSKESSYTDGGVSKFICISVRDEQPLKAWEYI